MRGFLILCAVLNALGALFWLANAIGTGGGGLAGGIAATLQIYFAASCFAAMTMCSFGAAVLDLLDQQRKRADRMVQVLELMERRMVPEPATPTQSDMAAEPHPKSWQAIRSRQTEDEARREAWQVEQERNGLAKRQEPRL